MNSFEVVNALLYFCRLIAGLLSLVLVIATVIPLIRSDSWWIRILDFPRIQIAVLMGLTLAGYVALRFFGSMHPWEYTLPALLGLGLVWQLYCIIPYTALYPREMAGSLAEKDSNRISLLVFNVLSDNRQVDALRDIIRDNDPDVILLNEPTQWWLEQLDGLEKDYPYTLLQPQENQYGMLLYSRLEMENQEIRFLIEPEIPSIRAQVRLRSGTVITFYCLHPRPPGLKRSDEAKDNGTEEQAGEDENGEREDSDMRDAELITVGKEINKLGNVPVIVAGDFNDVAWSHTTHLFQRIGGLIDPRVGRGYFNTFDTRSRLMRYPLDHVFASEHFLLVELRRLPDIGSDHFPMLAVFDYDPAASVVNEEPEPDAGDKKEAAKAIEEGKSDE
ncbi:endonuclease/exonuclease/phosphatase family protein [Pelagicoccus sp. SDUM812003]|uniref:endonuclease/exonuclease/phosphatase family protein n=1 Tax=Pelagicoccus sp. SDUM812003 TaxID=3041267 RepID=UPI00280CE6FB|nr:endonuclease/exonuclease/phosphatase family protein [Pelagicoccus sp. SDUM812003]MDQ8204732.1 endonuclease/exonuclease/phosphatase family protein [Pelagicoccus sp. SDUM812003]